MPQRGGRCDGLATTKANYKFMKSRAYSERKQCFTMPLLALHHDDADDDDDIACLLQLLARRM